MWDPTRKKSKYSMFDTYVHYTCHFIIRGSDDGLIRSETCSHGGKM